MIVFVDQCNYEGLRPPCNKFFMHVCIIDLLFGSTDLFLVDVIFCRLCVLFILYVNSAII